MLKLTSSVGRCGRNLPSDVLMVQGLLNQNLGVPYRKLPEDGKANDDLVVMIEEYQRRIGYRPPKSGVIYPRDQTWLSLTLTCSLPSPAGSAGLSESDFQNAANILGCEVAAIIAVTKVESPKGAFLPSGRPTLLFEAHIFSRNTSHQYDVVAGEISSKEWNPKLYKGGEQEYDRLQRAMCLDRSAAITSASYGRFQIMGFNYNIVGYATVEQFVAAMFRSERCQLDAFVAFIRNKHLAASLKGKNWQHFARGYNGRKFKSNRYDKKIRNAYNMVKTLEFDRALRLEGMALV